MTELKRITAIQYPDMIIRLDDIIESDYNNTFSSKAYLLKNRIKESGKISIIFNTELIEEITIKYEFPLQNNIDINSMYIPIIINNIVLRVFRVKNRINYRLSHLGFARHEIDIIPEKLSYDFNEYFDRFINSNSSKSDIDPSLIYDIIREGINILNLSEKLGSDIHPINIMDSNEKELRKEIMNYKLLDNE